MPLTDTVIKSTIPGEKLIKLSDAEGLQIHVHPNGSRLWRLAYRFGGKQKLLALGRYPDVCIREARKKRSMAKADLAAGLDPSAARAKGNTKGLPTFADVAQEYLDIQKQRGRAAKTLAKLEGHARQANAAFGHRPVAQIKASEILALLRTVESSGKHVTAAGIRALCGRVFRYAVATDRADSDPAAPLVGALVAPPTRGYPAILDRKEIGDLMRAIKGYQGEPMTRTGLLLAAYTFLRPGEVAALHWSDVDFDAARIVIPAERMKMPRAHVVPLSTQVVGFLREIEPLTGRFQYVLQSLRSTDRHISDNTLNSALRRMGYRKEEMVAHGFRQIASTLLNEDGFNADWIERQLAHVEKNKVRRAYDKSEHLEGRTTMMQDYADLLDRLEAAR